MPEPQYGEPWSLTTVPDFEGSKPHTVIVANSGGELVINGHSDGLHESALGRCAVTPDSETAARIVACVNFLRYVPTEKLIGKVLPFVESVAVKEPEQP